MAGSAQQWRRLVEGAAGSRPTPVAAWTAVRPLKGISGAVVIDCSDGRRYAVKGCQVGRALIADQVVGRLGAAIGAPVAEVGLVDVSAELIAFSSHLQDAGFDPGAGHGSVFIPDCTDNRDVAFEFEPENKERYALLAVLYGWALADDRQYLYEKRPPRRVHSVDHGHFLAGGVDWTVETLAAAPAAELDIWITSQAAVDSGTQHAAIARLRSVSDATIARTIATPPETWGISLDERVALAKYFARRRDELLALLPPAD